MNALLKDRKENWASETPPSPCGYQDPHWNVNHQPPSVHDSQAPNSVFGVVGKTTVNSEIQSADVPSTFGTAIACIKGPSRLRHAKTALY